GRPGACVLAEPVPARPALGEPEDRGKPADHEQADEQAAQRRPGATLLRRRLCGGLLLLGQVARFGDQALDLLGRLARVWHPDLLRPVADEQQLLRVAPVAVQVEGGVLRSAARTPGRGGTPPAAN